MLITNNVEIAQPADVSRPWQFSLKKRRKNNELPDVHPGFLMSGNLLMTI